MIKSGIKDKRGFTLMELLVAMAIFATLSSFMIVKYADNEKLRTLNNQTQEIIAGLESAQNMALTGQEVDNRTPLGYKFKISECGSGCSYSLLAVFSDDPASDALISAKALGSATISSIKLDNAASNELTVKFSPPRGKMLLPTSDPQAPAIDAFFQIGNDQPVKFCIKLNSVSGRIDRVAGPCP